MRLIAVIVQSKVIEKILRHMKLWFGPAAFAPARPPPDSGLENGEPNFRIEYDPMP